MAGEVGRGVIWVLVLFTLLLMGPDQLASLPVSCTVKQWTGSSIVVIWHFSTGIT